jgi:DNA polymerase III epsilon subunit-like protein
MRAHRYKIQTHQTHDWLDGHSSQLHIGQFGFTARMADEELAYQRIVQIGWVVGGAVAGATAERKSMYVRPEGFTISPKAEGKHGKSQSLAEREGKALADVLRNFMSDVVDASEKGGRVVAHQIETRLEPGGHAPVLLGRKGSHIQNQKKMQTVVKEFDAGVIYRELGRCGLDELQTTWVRIVREGFCTMDPSLGRWVKDCAGKEVGESWVGHTLRLDRMFKLLLPTEKGVLEHHHDACYDAAMTRMIYMEALRRARDLTKTSTA